MFSIVKEMLGVQKMLILTGIKLYYLTMEPKKKR